MRSPSDELRDLGIASDTQSLLRALSSRGEKVQSLVAAELAEQHYAAAHTKVQEAFLKASDSINRLNLAQALFELNASEGTAALQQECENPKENVAAQLRAVAVLQNAGSHMCEEQIGRLATFEESSVKMEALTLLNHATTLGRDQKIGIGSSLLHDKDRSVRLAAGRYLVEVDDTRGVSLVSEQAAVEPDPATRDSFFRLLRSPSK